MKTSIHIALFLMALVGHVNSVRGQLFTPIVDQETMDCAQTPMTDTGTDVVLADLENALYVELDPIPFTPPRSIRSSHLMVEFRTSGQHLFGSTPFTASISFRVRGYAGTTLRFDLPFTLMIDQVKPQQRVRLDLGDLNAISTIDHIRIVRLEEGDLAIDGIHASRVSFQASLLYETSYGFPPEALTIDLPEAVAPDKNEVRFTWDFPPGNQDYPLYEVQVLRLYETGSTPEEDALERCMIDWTQATTFTTNEKELDLALCEGTGFYAWRVRPYSDYYEAESTHPKNWGAWSDHVGLENGNPVLDINTSGAASNGADMFIRGTGMSSNAIFYYKQFDADRNWIYSRTFSDGTPTGNGLTATRFGEQMTYATGLRQVDQDLVRNGTSMLASQTVLDLAGRAALTSLPVPLGTNKTLGYIPNLLDPVEDDAQVVQNYDALDFDADETISENRQVDGSTTLYDYYSGNNAGTEVPSAAGYPFSRTVFNADGSVQQSSGPGLPFAFNAANAPPRTTKTYHLGTTTTELARIFGEEMYHPNTVQQVLTIDPNGVTSSTYVDKEGRTLATSIIKADALDFNEPSRTLLPLPSELAGTYEISATLGANIPSGSNALVATTLIQTDIPGQEVDFYYELDIKTIAEQCVQLCTTCDHRVEFTLVDQQHPDVDLLDGLFDVPIPAPDVIGQPPCDEDLIIHTATIAIAEPGIYLLTRRITTNNAITTGTTAPNFLDQHLADIHDALEGGISFQDVDALLDILYADGAELADFFAEAGVDVDNDEEFILSIGCEDFIIPVRPCEPCIANREVFLAHLEEQYALTATEYNADPNNTPILPLNLLEGNSVGQPMLAYTGTGSGSTVQFSLDELEDLLTNMLAEPASWGYSCENLRACWIGAVSAYLDAMGTNGTPTLTIVPPEDTEAAQYITGNITIELRIMDLFLKCAGRQIQGYSTSASGTQTTVNATQADMTDALGYLTHAYAMMQGAPEETGPCIDAVITAYDIEPPPEPDTWHLPINFEFENADDLVTTGWQIYYECVLGRQMANDIDYYPSGDEQSVEDRLTELRGMCYERCEDRRESFEAALWEIHPGLVLTDPDDQELIQCTLERVVDQCIHDCNAVVVLTQPGPSYRLGPQNALERVQNINTGHFELALTENGVCPEGMDPVNMVATVEPDPATFPTEAQFVALINEELNLFVDFACAFDVDVPSTYSSNGWSAGPNATTAIRSMTLPGSACNRLVIKVHVGYNGSDSDPLQPCEGYNSESFACLSNNRKSMSIELIDVYLYNGSSTPYQLLALDFGGDDGSLNSGMLTFDNFYGSSSPDLFTGRFGRFTTAPNGISYQRIDFVIGSGWVSTDLEYDATHGTPLKISECEDDFQSPLLHGFEGFQLQPPPPPPPTSWALGLADLCGGVPPTTMTLPDLLSQPGLGCMSPCPGPPVCIRWAPGMGFPGEPDMIGLLDCDSVQRAFYADLLEGYRYDVEAAILNDFAADYLTTCAGPDSIVDLFTAKTLRNQHHYTLYYYDRAGNLISTIPPKGVRTLTVPVEEWPTTETDHKDENDRDHRTVYKHNSLGQVVEQTTPNGGTSRFFYDAVGRLRLSQNAQQKEDQRYAYTKYDALGRVVTAGVSTLVASGFGTTLEDMLAAPELTDMLSSDQDFPASATTETVTTTYTTPTAGLTYLDGRLQRHLLNRVASTASDVDGDPDTWEDRVITHYSYDPHGNVEWLVQSIPFLGKRYIAYTYDLISGRVLSVRYNEGRPDQFFHRYVYDTEGRISTAETSHDGEIWDNDARYIYYPHGPLSRSVLGQDEVQGLDYSYTIQGWLKGINDPRLVGEDAGADGIGNSRVGRDAFGMLLHYFQDDFQAAGSVFANAQPGEAGRDLYNGNIMGWGWNSQVSEIEMSTEADPPDPPNPFFNPDLPYLADKELGFSYRYDVLNRLRNTRSQQLNGTWIDHSDERFNTAYNYDANGNFTQGPSNEPGILRRDHEGALMDQIDYNYNAPPLPEIPGQPVPPDYPDVLTSINENIPGSGADLDSDHDYTYDKIGQLISESWGVGANAGSNTIHWTASGKVSRVDQSNGRHLLFLYDAAGHRVLKADVSDWQTALTMPAVDDEFNYYVRDAQGNPMAIYKRKIKDGEDPGEMLDEITLHERSIYGSSRLGVRNSDILISEGVWNAGVFEPIAPTFNYVSEVEHLQSSSFVNLGFQISGLAFVLPLHVGFHTEPTPTPTFTSEFAAFWARESNNTYRAEDLHGQLIFKTHYLQFLAPNASNSRLHVQDTNGNLVWNSEGLIGTNNTPTLSAQNPLNEQQYFIFTMDALGRPYYNVFDRSFTDHGSLGEIVEPRNRQLWDDNDLFAPCMAVIDDRTNYGLPVLYLLRRGNPQSDIVAIDLTVLAANSTTTPVLATPQTIMDSYPALDSNGASYEMQVSPNGKYLAVTSRLTNNTSIAPAINDHQIRLYSIDPDHLGLGDPQTHTFEDISRISSLDFSPESAYLYFVQTYGTDGHRLFRMSVPGSGQPEMVQQSVRFTEVRRLKGDRMLCTNVIPSVGQRNVYVITNPNATEVSTVNNSVELVWSLNTSPPFSAPRLSPHLALQPLIIHNENSIFTRHVDQKRYELTDHLGNVRSVVSDLLLADYNLSTNTDPTNLRAKVESRPNYYPFGSLMPGRNYNAGSYRNLFQGQEHDDEIFGSAGSSYAYKYRMHDPRIGRFWSIDPLAAKYPHNSPYAFSENRVIDGVELEGLEWQRMVGYMKSWTGYDDNQAGNQAYERQFAKTQLKLANESFQKAKYDLLVRPIVEEPRLAMMAAPLAIILAPEMAAAASTVVELGVPMQLLDGGSEAASQLIFNGGDLNKVDRMDVAATFLPGLWEVGVQSTMDWSGEGFGSVFTGEKSIGETLLEGTVGAAFHKTGEELLRGAPNDQLRNKTFEFKWDLFKTGVQEQGKKALQDDAQENK
jgi:RHS repeat-associated protein